MWVNLKGYFSTLPQSVSRSWGRFAKSIFYFIVPLGWTLELLG